MTLPKIEVVYEGNVPDTFTDVGQATGLCDYASTLIFVKNTNLSGAGNSLKYSILVTPKRDESTVDWYVLVSGAILTSGMPQPHLIRDPWDGVKVQLVNATSGDVAQAKVYINRKPRGG